MPQPVTISEVLIEDKQQILKMWESLTLELPKHHFKPFGEPVLSERSQMLSDMFNNSLGAASAVVLKIGSERCLGTISAVLNKQSGFVQENSGVIFNLWIEPDYRRLGYATDLVSQAKKWLKEQGATTAQVGWHPENEVADRFWKKQGFRNYEVIAATHL